jgi:addiction module HigA family antidote
MPMKNPPHPGDFIRTEIIQLTGLSVTAAAAALKVSRPALSSLLNGKASLSGDMALRIEKAFGVKMDTLMRMQSAYDIARTRRRERQIRVRRIPKFTVVEEGAYEHAHRQATDLLDEGFHLGGAIPASRGDRNNR